MANQHTMIDPGLRKSGIFSLANQVFGGAPLSHIMMRFRSESCVLRGTMEC